MGCSWFPGSRRSVEIVYLIVALVAVISGLHAAESPVFFPPR